MLHYYFYNKSIKDLESFDYMEEQLDDVCESEYLDYKIIKK